MSAPSTASNTATGAVICLLTLSAAAGTLDEARDHHRAGRLEQALSAYADVIAGQGADTERATALNNRCVIRTDRSDFAGALEDCRAALDLRATIGDERSLARTLNNLGRVHERRGEFDQARAHYGEALLLNRSNADIFGQTINHLNLGVLATQAGGYAEALREYRAVEALAAANQDQHWAPRQQILAQLNQAVVLERIGAFEDALSLLDDAAIRATDQAPDLRSDVLLNRGVVLRNLGDPAAALAAYDAARQLIQLREDRAAVANVMLNIALLKWRDLGQTGEGMRGLQDALAAAAQVGEFSVEFEARYYLCLAQIQSGERAAAQRHVAALGKEASRAGHLRWLAADAAARFAFGGSDRAGAAALALATVDAIEAERSTLMGSGLRDHFVHERRAAYELAVAALFRVGGSKSAMQAFEIAMRAKALALIETLGDRPLLAAGTSAQAVQSALGERALLEFFAAPDALYRWSVTATSVDFQRLDADAALATLSREIRAALAANEPVSAQSLTRLSAHLLADVALPSGSQLFVAPHGPLNGLPFEVLILADGRRLIEHVPVSYVPAGSLLAAEQRVMASPTRLIAFARARTDDALRARHPALAALPVLGGADRELDRIATLLGGEQQLLRGARASEVALAHIESARVVHIASHAVLDSALADGAVLVLAGEGPADGLVFPRELAELDLDVGLTVLSACSTAIRKDERSAPLTTLSGAFLAAGSRAVLATLWDVGDDATAAFMEQFYARLARGDTPAAALRATKMTMLAAPGWSQPSRWAAYVLIGEAAPVVDAPQADLRMALALAGAALLLFTCLVVIRRRL